MFSSIKKKQDEYKQHKITYPILGTILGTTLGYYSPIVFLFTKFLSITAVGGIGGYSGRLLTDNEIDDNHYKKCVFKKYLFYDEKFQLNDDIFRKYMIEHKNFDINYSYRTLIKNIANKDHVMSKCFRDMYDNFSNKWQDNDETELLEFLNYMFYHICQYYIHIKDIKDNSNVKNLELEDASTFDDDKMDNTLLKIFQYNDEIFLKLYISVEKIICDDIFIEVINKTYKKFNEEDSKIIKYREELLKIEKVDKNIAGLTELWSVMFNKTSLYERLSIFYDINKKISDEILNITQKNASADDIMPILIHSLLQCRTVRIYSEYRYLKLVYNGHIYDNIFEFLLVKYESVVTYILNTVENMDHKKIDD